MTVLIQMKERRRQDHLQLLNSLFNFDDAPQVLRIKRIAPKYDPIKNWNKRLQKNFGTTDGLKIKEAVEHG